MVNAHESPTCNEGSVVSPITDIQSTLGKPMVMGPVSPLPLLAIWNENTFWVLRCMVVATVGGYTSKAPLRGRQ